MSNSKTGWLNENPLNPNAGGPGELATNPFMGVVSLNRGDMVTLYNLMISPTFIGMFVGMFADAKEWLSRLLLFPFPIPSLKQRYYVKYGAIDTAGLSENDRLQCYRPVIDLPGGNNLRSMGKMKIEPYFNNFMDYNGYTKIEIYLPFCGQVEVMANDVMNQYLYVDLYIDYYTGKGMYYVSTAGVDNADTADRRIILTKDCTVGYQIPLGGTGANETLRNMVMGAVKTTATVAALGFMSSGSSATATRQTVTKSNFNKAKVKTGSTRKTTTKKSVTTHKKGGATLASAAIAGSFSALASMHMNPEYDRSNNPLLDIAGPKSVKVIIKRPLPIFVGGDYKKLYGRPLATTKRLGDLIGFTKINGIHLENFTTALAEELDMLDDILKTGVILDGDNEVVFPGEETLLETSNGELFTTIDNKYIELEV